MLLKRIARGQDIQDLRILSKYTEPAQYYARNWEKWNSTEPKGTLYSQYERLNRFVDALPVESYAVYEMQDLVNEVATGNQQALEQLAEHYQQAKSAALAAETVFAGNVSSVETVVVAEKTIEVADLALTLIAKAQAGEKVREADVNAYQAILSDSAKIYDESIIAIVRPTELLLKQLAE